MKLHVNFKKCLDLYCISLSLDISLVPCRIKEIVISLNRFAHEAVIKGNVIL